MRYYEKVKERCEKRMSREEVARRREKEIAGSFAAKNSFTRETYRGDFRIFSDEK